MQAADSGIFSNLGCFVDVFFLQRLVARCVARQEFGFEKISFSLLSTVLAQKSPKFKASVSKDECLNYREYSFFLRIDSRCESPGHLRLGCGTVCRSAVTPCRKGTIGQRRAATVRVAKFLGVGFRGSCFFGPNSAPPPYTRKIGTICPFGVFPQFYSIFAPFSFENVDIVEWWIGGSTSVLQCPPQTQKKGELLDATPLIYCVAVGLHHLARGHLEEVQGKLRAKLLGCPYTPPAPMSWDRSGGLPGMLRKEHRFLRFPSTSPHFSGARRPSKFLSSHPPEAPNLTKVAGRKIAWTTAANKADGPKKDKWIKTADLLTVR